MTNSLQPYPAYKDSDQTWVGVVPRHWSVLPNRAIFAEVNDREHPTEEMLSVTITRGIVPQKALLADSSKKDSSNLNKSAYKLVQPRDIAYNKMRAWQGAIGASDLRGIISPAYVIMRLREETNLPRYFHHLFRTPSFSKEAERWSYGITSDMWSLRPEHFKMIYTPIPPPSEQAAIVRFLDHAHNRIDRAIRAKGKIMALLNEQKQAIIHHAVTRGLDPDVLLKPSGIPWLGEIPRHWEVCTLRMRYSVELGKMLDAQRIKGRYLVPYLRNRDVQWDKVLVDDLPKMDIRPEEYPRYTVQKGDMLVCEGGQVGRSAFWNAELPLCGFQKALHRVRPLDMQRDCPRFFFYQMRIATGSGIFTAEGNENTIAHLTCEKFRSHRFTYPPYKEQKAIANKLNEELIVFSAAIANLEREIALLREYRTRLTADVVTGKLDVRAAVATLPDPAAPACNEPSLTTPLDEPDATEDPDLDPEVEEADA